MLYFFLSLSSCALYLQHEEKSFISWMRSTNQIFTGDEYFLRLGIYLTNSRYVKQHNSAKKGFYLALNKFAVYTPTEYKSLLGFRMKIDRSKPGKSSKKSNIDSIDWREKGVVNPIQDQGNCGSCWAFSAIQALESANAIKYGQLQKYSEQELVDCYTCCSGCDGGNMRDAFLFAMQYHDNTFVLGSDYKYTAKEGTCKFTDYPHAGKISEYVEVFYMDEDDLKEKVQLGPVSVAIDASSSSFSLYSSGIYNDNECSSIYLDHGVGCVGFGVENGTQFWIVRNSWGASWGENGYIRMIRQNNQCGIASSAIIPFA